MEHPGEDILLLDRPMTAQGESGRRSGWYGTASTSTLPPDSYWEYLHAVHPDRPVDKLKDLSDRRLKEFLVSDLPPNSDGKLLEVMAVDGWVTKETRVACASNQCDHTPSEEDILSGRCPVCDEILTPENTQITVYTRNLARRRDVSWAVVIHGMNTRGTWQEEFSWFLGTTWGRSIPVAIYKYGIVIAGVLMPWRRRKLQRLLRKKLAELRRQARTQGYGEVPDVIVHSFGTWLLGHLLQDELKSGVEDPLTFGRIILTGCVLRPDYNWNALKKAGLVKEVLNHFATKDAIVPLAHWTIWDSGPSGRRGFDDTEVYNVQSEGLGHSDLFSTKRCIINGKQKQRCPDKGARGMRHLDHTYEKYWRPFLTLPSGELSGLPDITPPRETWRQAPALLRGTLFQVLMLPLLLSLLLMLLARVGGVLSSIWSPLLWISGILGGGLILVIVLSLLHGMRRNER